MTNTNQVVAYVDGVYYTARPVQYVWRALNKFTGFKSFIPVRAARLTVFDLV
jgi:hypothetical protein